MSDGLPLAVVLGASGRVGRRLCPALRRAGFAILGVTRSRLPGPRDAGIEWLQTDLCSVTERRFMVTMVADRARGHVGVAIVDVVVDRSGVAAMRQSLRGTTDAVLLLRDQLARLGIPVTLTAASTTAVLAPKCYQTPYGIAKRRQAIAYVRSGVPGSALLLPLLTEEKPPPDRTTAGWPTWSFDGAANLLVRRACRDRQSTTFGFRLPALDIDDPYGHPSRDVKPPLSAGLLLSHIRSRVTARNSMSAHRSAARARLLWTPAPLRHRVDHHRAPAGLLRRFASRHRVAVHVDGTTTEGTHVQGSAGHE